MTIKSTPTLVATRCDESERGEVNFDIKWR